MTRQESARAVAGDRLDEEILRRAAVVGAMAARLAFGDLPETGFNAAEDAFSAAAALGAIAARGAAPGAGPNPAMDAPEKVARRLARLRGLRKEHVVALYLNARHQELRRETVSIGTLTASLIHPREVFAPAIAAGSAGVVVAHNHPSGDPSPSPEDREVTARLSRAGELLGIPLVDHVIVAVGGHFSFRERGLL